MRWAVFWIFALVFLAIQLSIREVLTLHSIGGVSPDLVACFAVFISLFASRMGLLWACWVLGVLVDISPQSIDREYFLIGPHALGYVAGGYVVLLLRTMVFRRHAITAGFLTLLFLIATGIVAAFVVAIRASYASEPTIQTGLWGELLRQCGIAVYSSLIAIPVGWLLVGTMPIWGFHSGFLRRSNVWSLRSQKS